MHASRFVVRINEILQMEWDFQDIYKYKTASLFIMGLLHFPAKEVHNFCFYFYSGNNILFYFMLFYEQDTYSVFFRGILSPYFVFAK